MTKEEVIKALDNGEKVTHSTFIPDEFIQLYPNNSTFYEDENKNLISKNQFWKYRTKIIWNNNWSIFK